MIFEYIKYGINALNNKISAKYVLKSESPKRIPLSFSAFFRIHRKHVSVHRASAYHNSVAHRASEILTSLPFIFLFTVSPCPSPCLRRTAENATYSTHNPCSRRPVRSRASCGTDCIGQPWPMPSQLLRCW